MKKILPTPNKQYEIIINNSFESLLGCVEDCFKPSKIFILTDSNVASLYLETVQKCFQDYPTQVYCIAAGEASKNLATVEKIYLAMVEKQFDRQTLVVALGGGVVGDIAGFVASTYKRGVPFIQIPTTVVAQHDSSIGGKVGVDLKHYKNMIGAFYQPLLVYINLQTLQTLPESVFLAGMSEVIKHAAIKDKTLFYFLKNAQANICSKNLETLENITYQSVHIKCEVVEADEKELGERKILNFGHTIGHSLETLSKFCLSHGEAVAYGMIAAAYISFERHFLTLRDVEDLVEVCRSYGLLAKKISYTVEDILKFIQYDKKINYGTLTFVLLKKIGEATLCQDVSLNELTRAISYMKKTCS
jgi:3-dehydroquinate synthase